MLAILVSTRAATAQRVSELQLAPTSAEVTTGFSEIAMVRELGDGRVVLLDSRDIAVDLVDFHQHTVKQIGRQGAGPSEYGYPMTLVPYKDDTTLVYDPQNLRLLVIDPSGKTQGFFAFGAPAASSGGDAVALLLRAGPTLQSDRLGAFYFQGPPFVSGRNGARPQIVDSLAIQRWEPDRGRLDTLAYVRAPPRSGTPVASVGGFVVSQPNPEAVVPFASMDQWCVTPGSRIVIAHVGEYSVDVVNPDGSRITGRPIPTTPVKLDDAFKDQWRERMRSAPMPMVEPSSWPDALPPFPPRALHCAPDETAWIQRSVAIGKPSLFDVVDRQAGVVRRWRLPAGTSVAGFGRGVVYVVRTDSDGLQYLRRYGLP